MMFRSSLLLGLTLLAASVPARTALVLPVSGEGIAAADLPAVNRLFQEAFESRYPGQVKPGKTGCGDRLCALEAVKADPADEVIHSSLYKLGGRLIFSAAVVNADGSGSFNQRLTAISVEDMEALTARMAEALATRRTTEQVANIDNITERETENEPNRRRSLYNGGLALGYGFPVGNSFDYEENGIAKQYEQMIRFTWLNTWEFRNDLALGADVTWAAPNVVGADLNLRYHFNRGDVSPFVGGGVGLHYVAGGGMLDEEERKSGPALNGQAGVMLFRTYDVNVMLRGQYQVIFNSDIDHGPAFDVGVSFRSKDKKTGNDAVPRSSDDDGMGIWGYTGLGALFLFIVGSANN
jgi:hypothetical protein